ncbi:E3 ubiquitin-protein ligase MARCHF3-like [Ornithodoros turicata]|uniref:E3 ubiquitin-protein ligase MARCHF3-like n=1 Tax=Ornithodoros turicata TaxID=34597 RepID=UPI003139E015
MPEGGRLQLADNSEQWPSQGETPRGQEYVPTCRFCLNNDNQKDMIMPCNCKGNLSHAHAKCVAVEIYQNRKPACHICMYHYNLRRDQRKTVVDWLVDKDNRMDHIICAASIPFALTMVMVLTFAWLEALSIVSNIYWFFSIPVILLLLVQTCTWMGFFIYSLWLYHKAYLQWRDEEPPIGF